METKVMLIDAHGAEIGETYSRRARQLVKQQRAIWADDAHTAIKFVPDQEDEYDLPTETPEAPPRTEKSREALYALAEKRILERKRMVRHAILFIPGYFVIWILWSAMTGGRMFYMSYLTMGFAWGMWTMFFLSRLRRFLRDNNYNIISPRDGEIRRKLRLEAEVDRLRRMGFRD